MKGTAGGAATLFRAIAAAMEPFYAGATLARNKLFDAGIKKVTRLPRPVISIGNITAGGTGKTPMVRWMASELRSQGRRVAVLSRGYKAKPGELGDELAMLGRALNDVGGGDEVAPVLLRANPDRVAAGTKLLAEHPEVDVILLDDGFQHRRLARDLDVVLINATEPFGFDHVLPRGLLREPLRGLRRAGVIVLTRCDRVGEEALARIEQRIRAYTAVPIVRSVHAQTGFRLPATPLRSPVDQPMSALAGRRWFLFCGIANPAGVLADGDHGGRIASATMFADHHDYSKEDVDLIVRDARVSGADVVVTTEKDWVKVEPYWATLPADAPPLWRIDVEIQFLGDGASVLRGLVGQALARGRG